MGRAAGRRRSRAGVPDAPSAELEELGRLRAELGGDAAGRDGGRWTAQGPDGLALSRASARGLGMAVSLSRGGGL